MTKFSYYRNLSPRQKQTYDRSDNISGIKLPDAGRFYPDIDKLKFSLASEDQPKTEASVQQLVTNLCDAFGVPRITVKVLARRPSRNWGEMHGLYEAEEGTHPKLTVWMRTAKRKQVVAFRTFLRTVIHEFIHHLDFTWLKLADSFHTEGFYKRESGLVKALAGKAP